jgi:hypothetical protein
MLRKTCRQPSRAALACENALGKRNEIGQQECSWYIGGPSRGASAPGRKVRARVVKCVVVERAG